MDHMVSLHQFLVEIRGIVRQPQAQVRERERARAPVSSGSKHARPQHRAFISSVSVPSQVKMSRRREACGPQTNISEWIPPHRAPPPPNKLPSLFARHTNYSYPPPHAQESRHASTHSREPLRLMHRPHHKDPLIPHRRSSHRRHVSPAPCPAPISRIGKRPGRQH
jgi:hypothetical protein